MLPRETNRLAHLLRFLRRPRAARLNLLRSCFRLRLDKRRALQSSVRVALDLFDQLPRVFLLYRSHLYFYAQLAQRLVRYWLDPDLGLRD